MKKSNSGITLIALVITIIVLLILAGIAINAVVGDNGIIKNAQKAKEETNVANNKEGEALNGKLTINGKEYDSIEDYVDGKEASQSLSKVLLSVAKTEGTVFDQDTIVEDAFGNTLKVPAGFKIASDSGNNVTQGVVIEDVNANDETSVGNQFVWIPVGKIYTDVDKTEENAKTIILGRYSWGSDDNTPTLEQPITGKPVSSAVSIQIGTNSYTESQPTQNGIDENGNAIAKNINDFYSHTIQAGGYYIGRYEAGDSSATQNRSFESSKGTIVCKNNCFVYDYISQQDASEESQSMYAGKNYTSDLMNSYAWDTALIFIQTFGGEDGTTYPKSNWSTNCDVKTGVNPDEILKIHDLSGSDHEFTTETCSDTTKPCTFRGGRFDGRDSSPFKVTSNRINVKISYGFWYYAFRPILYW